MGLDFNIYKIKKTSLPEKYKEIHGTLDNDTMNDLSKLLEDDFYLRKPHPLLDYFSNNLVNEDIMQRAWFFYTVSKEEINDIILYTEKILNELIFDLFSDDWEISKMRQLLTHLNQIIKNEKYIYTFEFDW